MKLFRRNPENPNCAWSVRFSVRNKIYPFSTQTTDKALALIRAKDYRNKIVGKQFGLADQMKVRGGAPTLASLVAIYDTLPAPVEHTKKRNVSALKAVLAASGLDLTARVDRLGAHIITAYQSAMLKAHPGSNSAMVSANSNVRMARSVLSKAALLSYRATLTIPKEPIEGFFNAPFLKVARPMKALPSPEALAKAEEVLKGMPAYYRAYLLARQAGLRAAEIKAARRTWLDGNVLRVGAFPDEFRPKSGIERRIAINPAVAELLLQGSDPVYLVDGPRNAIVNLDLNRVLRECGFTDPKPLHSLRRLFGSLLFSHQSPAIAQAALGHSSLTVTQDHYATLLTQQKAVDWAG